MARSRRTLPPTAGSSRRHRAPQPAGEGCEMPRMARRRRPRRRPASPALGFPRALQLAVGVVRRCRRLDVGLPLPASAAAREQGAAEGI
jgi:hypothetical protein